MSSYEQYLIPAVLQKVARLDLRARFLVEGFVSGLHDSPYKGFSVEFSDHRKYTRGDEIRRIDWKVFSRTDRYYIKRFQAETNMECHVLVDTSASMGYEPLTVKDRFMTKLEYSTAVAAALGYLMTLQQDAVGLITFDDRVREYVRPGAKRSHLARMLSVLSNVRPSGATDVSGAIHQAAGLLRKRGLVVILSDLLDEPDRLEKALAHVQFRGHDCIVFHVLDAAEANFPFDGPTRFIEPETAANVVVDAGAVRAGYLAAVSGFVSDLRRRCRARGIDYVQLDTSVTFDTALTSFLLNRQKNFL